MIDIAAKLAREGFTLATSTSIHTNTSGVAEIVANADPYRVYLEVSSPEASWTVGWTSALDPLASSLSTIVPASGFLCWKYADVGSLVQQTLYGFDEFSSGTGLYVTEVRTIAQSRRTVNERILVDTAIPFTRDQQTKRMSDIRQVIQRIRSTRNTRRMR